MASEDLPDPDEILRDIGDVPMDDTAPENVREMNFGSRSEENANFIDMAGDLDLDLG